MLNISFFFFHTVKLGSYQDALDHFQRSLDMAKLQEDSLAESAIKKAIEDVNQRIVKELKEGDDKGSQKGRLNCDLINTRKGYATF